MKLKAYLDKHKITPARFADNIGVSSEAVRLWLLGRRFPKHGYLQTITAVTNGKVTANDFHEAD